MLIVAYILGPRGISNASCSAVMKIHFALLVDFALMIVFSNTKTPQLPGQV
jgi:hypothetical protein